MNLNHFYHYYKSKSGGLSNLLLGSEELDQSDQGEWVRYNMNAVNANVPGVANPLSSDETVEQLDFEASRTARIAQTVTLTAGTEYTFSVWARAASGTEPFRLRYWDNVGGSGGGSAFTASATWDESTGRYEMTFTAQNSGQFQVFIQNAADGDTRRIYFWGAMLNVGATALDYVKTEFPAGPSNPPTAPMEFGDNFAGVTAYYSLRRFTKGEDNNAIRVRRSSDDTEQDIGFDSNGDLDTTALTTFVNADVNQYTSDFSVNDDGWAVATDGGTAAGNIDGIGGQDNVLRFTVDTSTTPNHRLENTTILDGGYAYTIEFEYYIPSTNANLDSFRVQNSGGSSSFFTDTDTWSSGSFSNTNGSGGYLRFQTSDGGTVNYTGNGTDVFYMKNIVVTQTTADGAVTTFYDQSGNGNHATNATASEQPLVVSGGTLVTENGKAAIEFDGVDDEFNVSVGITTGFAVFGVYKNTKANSYIIGDNPELGRRSNNQYRFRDSIGFSAGANGGTHSNNQVLIEGLEDGANARVYANGVEQAFTASTFTSVTIDVISKNYVDGTMQELIIFNSDQSGNRTGIETNINDHFNIYT